MTNSTKEKSALKNWRFWTSAIMIIFWSYKFGTDYFKKHKSYSTKTSNRDTSTLSKIDTFKIECDNPNIDDLIVHSDTIVDDKNYKGHKIKSFDSKWRLRKILIANLYESNISRFYASTFIYDTVGNLIYETKTNKGICWHCYSYKYDTNNHFIGKTGYSSGEIGVKLTYIYKGDKLVKEITERAWQKSEKIY